MREGGMVSRMSKMGYPAVAGVEFSTAQSIELDPKTLEF
jgi:hypothetical protein